MWTFKDIENITESQEGGSTKTSAETHTKHKQIEPGYHSTFMEFSL